MQLQAEELDEISKETGFTTNQVKRLYSRFTSLDKDNTGYLDKTDFERIPELHVNPMRDRILEVLINDNGKRDLLCFQSFFGSINVIFQFLVEVFIPEQFYKIMM